MKKEREFITHLKHLWNVLRVPLVLEKMNKEETAIKKAKVALLEIK